MKRSGPPERKTPLNRKSSLNRGKTLERKSSLTPGKRRRKAAIPKRVRATAKRRSHGACVVCLVRAGLDVDRTPRAVIALALRGRRVRAGGQLHHVLPERDFPAYAKLAENLVAVCPECHDEHERAHRRVPIAALAMVVVGFVRSRPDHELASFERIYGALPASREEA